ncbi:MAG: glycogen/starch synthase [Candidatus Woesearchaeota archaeon]|nr:MAG: glycogen/starch synthase [Candidatus Woesearchaeota archaeon]
MEKPKADILFEVSWEVCNKFGGIYTVIKSKVNQTVKQYGDNYFLIGPYFMDKALGLFSEQLPPEGYRNICKELRDEGIIVKFGKWLIKGRPNTILIEFSDFAKHKDAIKKELWDNFEIDSLFTDYFDFDQPVIWAYAVGKLIEKISAKFPDKKMVLQAHEWLAGPAILYLKKNNVPVSTVFTTHATTLGRTLANSHVDLYAVLNDIKADEKARSFRIQAKHQMEKQSAMNSSVFTTVSEITGIEAEHLLGKKPDIILPNGLDLRKFPTFEELSIKHKIMKDRIKEFIMFFFFPYYTFDLDNTLIFFIAGRYEFHDKGVDVLIKALCNLNEKFKKDKSKKTIVVFFWIPAGIRNIRQELIENREFLKDIKNDLLEQIPDIKTRLLYLILSKKVVSEKNLLSNDFLDASEGKIMRFERKNQVPSVSTHDLQNINNDLILNSLRNCGLSNRKEDRIKVILYPIYLTGADGLLNTDYYESIIGSHLGIFPSFYEPWGYTPLECAALGVASVTTDLAGFGRYIRKEIDGRKYPGIFVLDRLDKSDDEFVEILTESLYNFSKLSKNERISNKIAAREFAARADWENFINYYIQAHNLAIKKMYS